MKPTDNKPGLPSHNPEHSDTDIDLVIGVTAELARHACDLYGIDPHRAFNPTDGLQRLNNTRNTRLLLVTTPDHPVPIEWGYLFATIRLTSARAALTIIPPPDSAG